jgi:hypothetical protein
MFTLTFVSILYSHNLLISDNIDKEARSIQHKVIRIKYLIYGEWYLSGGAEDPG